MFLLGLLAVGVPAVSAQDGCYCRPRHFQPALSPEPLGSFVHRFQAVQAGKAEASDFEIYLDEWYQGGKTLGPYGQYHVNQIAQRLPTVPFAVKVQPCNDSVLNETRRMVVVTALLNLGITDADTRVVLAYPQAEGLRGEEAELVYFRSIYDAQAVGRFGSYFGFNRSGFGLGFGSYYSGSGLGYFGRGFLGARPLIAGY
jgi:hypothetical protein